MAIGARRRSFELLGTDAEFVKLVAIEGILGGASDGRAQTFALERQSCGRGMHSNSGCQIRFSMSGFVFMLLRLREERDGVEDVASGGLKDFDGAVGIVEAEDQHGLFSVPEGEGVHCIRC
jgi:hypothetical protein